MKDDNLVERFVAERRAFDGRLVKVNVMDVTLPDGKPAVREVVRHMGASAVVPVDDSGVVTMVRQYRAAVGKVLLEVPAGKLDSAQEDRLDAARSELKEETGLTAKKWTLLTDIVTSPGFCDERLSIYLAEGLESGDTHPDADEFLNAIRYPLDELYGMAMRGEICDSKTLIGILMAKNCLEARRGV